MISEVGQQITNRFFEAVDSLVSEKKLRGVQTLAKQMGVGNATLRKLKLRCKNNQKHSIKPEFMHFLVTEYGVSAEWLLTGKGKMFDK